MEAVPTPDTSVYSKETSRRYIPEYSNLHTHRRENLKSHIFQFHCSQITVLNNPSLQADFYHRTSISLSQVLIRFNTLLKEQLTTGHDTDDRDNIKKTISEAAICGLYCATTYYTANCRKGHRG
jgi:hypothetical protein